MDMVGVDVAVLQETKITDPAFASREFGGYSILTAAADSTRRGGGRFWSGRATLSR